MAPVLWALLPLHVPEDCEDVPPSPSALKFLSPFPGACKQTEAAGPSPLGGRLRKRSSTRAGSSLSPTSKVALIILIL